MTNDEAVKIVKSQFVKVGKGVITGALTSWAPPLGVPPLNIITGMIAQKIMKVLSDDIEIGAFFIYTNFNVDSQGRLFMDSAIKNHNTQLSGTPEEKKIAEDNLKDAFRKLIRFSN